MVDNSTLADVKVEVSADLSQLERDFARAKDQAHKVENDLKKITDPRIAQSKANAEASRRLEQQYLAQAAASRRLGEQARRSQEALRNELLLTNRLGTAHQNVVPPINSHDKAITRLGKSAGLLTFFLRGLIATLGVDLVSRLASGVVNVVKTTAALGDMAQAVSMTTTQFQEWRGIASMLGIDQQKLTTGLGEFAENARQAAAGADREERVFKRLGVSLKDSAGGARDMNSILLDTIQRLGQVRDPLQRGAALAFLFGESVGPEMAKLIDAGVSKIDQLREAVHATGMVLGEDEIQKADETAKKLEQVKMVLDAKIASTVVENADAINTLADALAGIATVALDATSSLIAFWGQATRPLPQIGGGSVLGTAFNFALNPAGTIGRVGQSVGTSLVTGPGPTSVRGLNQAGTSVTVDVPLRSTPKPAPGPNIDLKDLFDRETKGRTGRTKREVENVFAREEAQVAQERLRLLRAGTVDLQRRNEIDHELIEWALKEKFARIDRDVKAKRLTEAQAKELKAQEEANAQLEREAADRQMRIDLEEQRFRSAQELLDAETQLLSAAEGLARTEEEQTKIAAAILKNRQAQELLEIDKQIEIAKQLGDEKRITELTELRRKMLERQGVETMSFAVDNLRGIEAFRNKLPQTVEEINEAIEKIRFDMFLEKLQDAARFAEDIGDAFGRAAGRLARFEKPLDVLKGLLQDLADTLTEQFIVKPVSEWAKNAIGNPMAKAAFGKDMVGPDKLTVDQMNLALDLATQNLNALSQAAIAASSAMGGTGVNVENLGGAAGQAGQGLQDLDPQLAAFGNRLMALLGGVGGGGGIGGFLKMGLSALGSVFGGGGLSDPGLSVLNTGSIANTNVDLSGIDFSNVMGGFAGGGWIGGSGTGRSDSNLIWASRGEHMTNADAAQRFAPILEGINSGLIPDIRSLGQLFAHQSRGRDRSDLDWNRLSEMMLRYGRRETNLYIKTEDANSFLRSERQLRSIANRRLNR